MVTDPQKIDFLNLEPSLSFRKQLYLKAKRTVSGAKMLLSDLNTNRKSFLDSFENSVFYLTFEIFVY